MGFCLAEMGLNLGIPNDPAAFAHNWAGLAAFAMSFLFVSVLWWYHHKLFATYFVLNPLTVTLNFVMLGTLALAVYFVQVALHFMTLPGVNPALPVLCWFGALAIVYTIISVQYSIGIAYRRASISENELRFGVNRVFRTAVIAVLMATFCAAVFIFHQLLFASYAMVGAIAILRILQRVLVPKITARLLAERAA
jgi:uncharacterized membrane protein